MVKLTYCIGLAYRVSKTTVSKVLPWTSLSRREPLYPHHLYLFDKIDFKKVYLKTDYTSFTKALQILQTVNNFILIQQIILDMLNITNL